MGPDGVAVIRGRKPPIRALASIDIKVIAPEVDHDFLQLAFTVDCAQNSRRLQLGSEVLGQIGKGFYHIMWELQGERLIGAAGCVAGAQRLFDRTLEYATERSAFGRPIGKFQAIRHKFADMATKIEAGRQMVYTTAWRFQNGEYPVREISMAKLYTARMACEVADECLQIHGGAGYMKEYGIERAWRDLRLNRIGAGTDEIMLDVIGRSYGI